jgi:plasmid stability protein
MLAFCWHNDVMGNLTIRNVDDELLARLKERAKANDRSMEGEARAILRGTLGAGDTMTVKWSELASYDLTAARARATQFEWDAFLRKVRENIGPQGTPPTAVEDIRAFREGRE